MQLPIASPIINSECISNEDFIVINISGSDVPIASIVKPISISESLNLLATLVAAFTNKSEPFIKIINPIIINIKSKLKILFPYFV